MSPAGRPALPDDERRDVLMSVRMTSAESAAVEAAARRSGKSVSGWARETLLRAARRNR